MRRVPFWFNLFVCGFVAGPAVPCPAAGQTNASSRGVYVEEVRNQLPAFHVRVAVDRPDRTYRDGDEMKVTVQSEADGYLYLFYLDAQGKNYVLFPNSVQKDNKVTAGRQVQIPEAGARFRLRVGAPFGQEVLKAVVTRQPLAVKGLEAGQLAERDITEVDLGKVRELFAAVKDTPGEWAEHAVEITTVARSAAPAPPATTRKDRRVGLFVGIGKYSSPVDNPPLPVCPDDARKVAEVMKARCGLDEAVVLVDEQATLRNVERAFRQTLIAKTRPGDTVVIFWSGHGTRFPTPGGKSEHALVVYDTPALNVPAQPAAADVRRAIDTLHKTTLTSNTLQRWLQDLDGRKVFLVADACRAGGLHERGKGLEMPGLSRSVEEEPFLANLMERAKALDQRELALLAGCKADEVSLVRKEGDLSVLTYFLIERLKAGTGPMTVRQTFDAMKEPLAAYVARIQKVQTPVLIDQMTPPFYLRLAPSAN